MKVSMTFKKSTTEVKYNPPPLSWTPKTKAWTDEKKREEYLKCKKDPAYFLSTYGCIQHPIRGKIRFALYDFQAELLRTVAANKNTIVLKSRQLGISTITAGLAAWYIIFYPDKPVLIIATKSTTAKNFLDKAKLIYQYTPKWMKPPVRTWQQMTLELDNSSVIHVSTTTADAGRSYAIALLVVDESAFIRNMQEIWTAAASTISTGGKAIALSTPNGAQGWFYQTCLLAEEVDRLKETGITLTPEQEATNFKLVTLPWHVHPERDEAWYENMCKTFNYDARQIAQELNCDFAASGQKVIMPEYLSKLKKDSRRVPNVAGFEGCLDEMLDRHLPEVFHAYNIEDEYDQVAMRENLKRCLLTMLQIYKVPAAGEEISFGVDVASGGASDYSAIVGMNKQGYQVCGFRGKVDTKVFSILLYLIGMYFNEASLAIERNSYGNDIILRLQSDIGYSNILDGLDMKTGYLTSGKTRNFYVSRLVGFLQNPVTKDSPVINDGRLLHELDVFVWMEHTSGIGKWQRAEAAKGENDDLVMALAILSTVLSTDKAGVLGIMQPQTLEAMANLLADKQIAGENTEGSVIKEDVYTQLGEVYMGVNYDDNPIVRQMEGMWDAFGIRHADRKKLKKQPHNIIEHCER